MPTPVVPRERLMDSRVVPVDKGVDAGPVIAGTVPAIDKDRRLRLRAAHRMEHKPFYCNFPPRRIAGIPG